MSIDGPLGAQLPQRPVFAVDRIVYDWGEILAAAGRWGLWADRERETAASLQRAAERRPGLDAGAKKLQSEFRTARQLFAADDLRAWLDSWELSVDDWRQHTLRRAALALHGPGESAESHELAGAWTQSELKHAAMVDVICLGEVEHWAQRLAATVAHFREQTGAPLECPPTDAELDGADRWAAATARAESALDYELRAGLLSWTRVDCDWVSDTREPVMRELSHCVRTDGMALRAAVEAAGLCVNRHTFYLKQTHSPLLEHLLAATPGDVIGPIDIADAFWLVVVLAKHPPTLDDEQVRTWATEAAMSRQATLAMARYVDWLAPEVAVALGTDG